MPEIARFYGIIIRMFMEPLTDDMRPHFHAYYYQEFVAVVAIDTVQLLAGSLPTKQLRLPLAWAELHQEELLTDLAAPSKRAAPMQNKTFNSEI